MRPRIRVMSLLVVSAWLAWSAGGAAVPAAATADGPTAPQETAQQEKPTFSIAIDLVTMDVIPRDGRGQFVPDLGKDDFELYEDGVPQEIASLVLSHGGRVFNVLTPPPPPAQEGLILPPARPASTAGRVLILFVDDLHFDALSTPNVRQLLRQILKTLAHEGDLVAMLTTGPSTVAIPPTYDRKLLDSAVSKVTGYGLTYADIMVGRESPTEGPADVRQRAANAFSTAYTLIQELESVRNRRKAVIVVSNGYDLDPYPAGRFGKDQVWGGRYGTPRVQEDRVDPFMELAQQTPGGFRDADLVAMMAELGEAANRANATFYTLDPRGLTGTYQAAEQIDPAEQRQFISKTQSSLRFLAELTGGLAVVNTNDFESALKRIDAETSDYYVLGYYSSNPDPMKRIRDIEVKVKREDVTVWSRTSYAIKRTATPPSSPQR